MSLLLRAPTQPELERLYHELAALGAPSVGRRARWPYKPGSREQLLALAGEMLRYDARLLSILLELMLMSWPDTNPLALRKAMRPMKAPQALLVVLEFAREADKNAELRYFVEYVGAGIGRVSPTERFFLDGPRPGGRLDRRQGARSLTAYSKWGFVGQERPATSANAKTQVGHYDARTRELIRRGLVERHGGFTMTQYLDAVDHGVTRQQAYQDLRRDGTLSLVGRGRGARWQAANQAPDT